MTRKGFVYILLIISLLSLITATSTLLNMPSFIAGMILTAIITYLIAVIEAKF
jgi:hypothetical protein